MKVNGNNGRENCSHSVKEGEKEKLGIEAALGTEKTCLGFTVR